MTYDEWKTTDPRDTLAASRMADAMSDAENSLDHAIERALNKYGRRVRWCAVLADEDGDEFALEIALRVRLEGHEGWRELAAELRRFADRLEKENAIHGRCAVADEQAIRQRA